MCLEVYQLIQPQTFDFQPERWVLAATGIIVAGMISRQRDQDAALRACLYERGYTVP